MPIPFDQRKKIAVDSYALVNRNGNINLYQDLITVERTLDELDELARKSNDR